MSHLNRRQEMSKQKSLPSSHCCPVYPVTHWQLKEPHSPWQRPRRPQDGKPMLTQLLSVVRHPGELEWDSAGFPRSYSWGEVIEGRWRSGHYGDQRSFPYMVQHSFILKKTVFFFNTSYNPTMRHLKVWCTQRQEQEQKQNWLVVPHSRLSPLVLPAGHSSCF